MLNPISFNIFAEFIGVAPPSIMFATRGDLISFPIFFISSNVLGASMNIASAPVFLFSNPLSIALSNPSVALASVLATTMKSLFSRASSAAPSF